MTKGWKYESNRHALAARGIKTNELKNRRVLVLDNGKTGTVVGKYTHEHIYKRDGKVVTRNKETLYEVQEDDGWKIAVTKKELRVIPK